MKHYFENQRDCVKKYFMIEKDIIYNADGSKSMKIEVCSTINPEELENEYEYVRQSGAIPVLKRKE